MEKDARTRHFDWTDLPIVVGVSGHRDVREEELTQVHASAVQALCGLRNQYQNATWALLSPLADGADQLVAEAALRAGYSLFVPLPMEREAYRATLTNRGREGFDRLAGQAKLVWEIAPLSRAASTVGPEAGNAAYAQLGTFMVRNVQFLVAVWDGVLEGPVGGTGDVVRRLLDGFLPDGSGKDRVLGDPPGGVLLHIPCTREGHFDEAGKSPVHCHEATAAMATRRRKVQQLIERLTLLNQDIRRHWGRISKAAITGRRELLGDMEGSPELTTAATRFAVVDSLANGFQRKAHLGLILLLAFTLAAATSLQLYQHAAQGSAVVLAVYLSLLAAGFAWYFALRWLQWENKYLDYRALAEGLRVQFFWRLVGIPSAAADYYLRRQQDVLEWIRAALRTILVVDPRDPSPAPDASRWTMVLRHWIQSEARYFERAAVRQRRLLLTLKMLGTILLATGALLALGKHSLRLTDWFTFWLSLPPVVAALLILYAQTRALSEQSFQHARMASVFGQAHSRMTSLLAAGDLEHARQLVLELGQETLAENGDWLILRRQRPVHPPGLR